MKKRNYFKTLLCVVMSVIMVLTMALNTDVLVSKAADTDFSAVFDCQYYYEHNEDLAQAFGYAPDMLFAHFLNYGMPEGRQGNAEFNVWVYKENYKDLSYAFGTFTTAYYMHYINFGKAEGRTAVVAGDNGNDGSGDNGSGVSAERYSAVFNAQYYYEHNGDVAGAVGNDAGKLFKHFLDFGMSEGRQGSAEFNVQTYKNNYEDLRNAFGDNLKAYYEHYVNCGKAEGRNASDEGDNGNGGSGNGLSAESYSAVFDAQYYYDHNSDVAVAVGNDAAKLLNHFVNYGMAEGRQGSADFDVIAYRCKYEDLRNAFKDNMPAYYSHYMNYGKAENRTANANEAIHKFKTDTLIEATCIAGGKTETKCTVCGHVKEARDIPFAEHTYKTDIVKAATCSENGQSQQKCSVCGKIKENSLVETAKTGHNYTDVVAVQATCEQEGRIDTKCANCGHVSGSQTVAKTDHTWGEYVGCGYALGSSCTVCPAKRWAPNGEDAYTMLNLINAERAECGDGPLTLDSGMCALATQRAQEITTNYSHNGCPAGYGENLTQGYSITNAYYDWKNSPAHYANMCGGGYTRMGFGWASSEECMYFVLLVQ